MAHNAYYPPQTPQHGQQGPLLQQQQGSSPGGQQYAQYYQQPQNIYQQLGQSQPQPHLQRVYQQPQYQQQQQPPPTSYAQPPVQSHGFVQRPLSTSFQAPQQSFANVPPSQQQFQQPPPPQQQQYVSQPQYQTSQLNTMHPPPRPLSRAPSATGFVPTSSYSTPQAGYVNQMQGQQGQMQVVAHDPNQLPAPSSSMVSQQQPLRRTPQPPSQGYANQFQGQMVVQDTKPPPVSPSAMLAHQVQGQRRTPQPPPGPAPPPQMQIQPRQIQQQQQQQLQPQQQPMQMRMQPQPQPLQQQQQQQQQQSQIVDDANGRKPLPRPVSGNPTQPTVGLVRSGPTTSRPISMPPTSTGRLPPISTSTSTSSFNSSQFNQSPNQQYQTPQYQQPMSAANIPPPNFVQRQIAQLQQMQQMQNQGQGQGSAKSVGSGMGGQAMGSSSSSSVSTPSPTKSRPLPAAPGGASAAAKRSTVDLGNVSGLPSPNTSFAFNSSTSQSSSASSLDTSPIRGGGMFNNANRSGGEGSQSPTKRFALPSTPGSSSSSAGVGLSRTTSMAAGQTFSNSSNGSNTLSLLDNDNTPKRRASPPKFSAGGSNSSSLSSSPTKEDHQRIGWNSDNNNPGSPTKATGNPFNRSSTNLSSGTTSNNNANATSNATNATNLSSTSSATTPQKFTPVWKRTIPDYPAPVFGYASGMVADPFAKPAVSPNTSSSNLPSSSSPAKNNDNTTPRATKVATAALTPKEKKRLEKEDKKRLKEEEKQRKKAAKGKGGVGAVVAPPQAPMQIQASPSGSSTSGASMLPYLQATPPRGIGVPGEYSRAYAQMQQQKSAQQQAQAGMVPYSTPTRQIQVRGQPVPPGAVVRYTQPIQQVSTEEEDEEDDDDEEDEDEDEESEEEDLEVAYQYEGSDYSSTSEQEYPASPAPVSRKSQQAERQIQHHHQQQFEEQQYYEQAQRQQQYQQQQQLQQQMAHLQQPVKTKKAGRTGASPQQYEEYEEQRPSPGSGRHVKTRSSASDGFVVVHQQSGSSPSQGSGRTAKPSSRKSGSASAMGPSPDRRSPAGHHSRSQSYSYSNSEDDWEQLQAYESSPRKVKPPKGKGIRRYEEPSEEEEDDEEEDDEEEQQYEERRRRGQGHRREVSERDGGTVRKYPVRTSEYLESRARGSPTKQPQAARGVKERVQDIDWKQQPQKQQRQYQQRLKYDDDGEDEDDDARGRQKKKAVMAGKKPSKTSIIKEILSPRSRSRSKHRYPEPDEEEEEEEEEEQYSRHQRGKSQSQSPNKKQSAPVKAPPRKLVKKNSKYFASNATSETESQADSRDGDDNESVATTNTQTSAASRLVSKFAGVMKFSGGQQKPLSPSQKSPTRETQPQPGFQSSPQKGFQSQPANKLFFGIADRPPSESSSPSISSPNKMPSSVQSPPARMVRGEVNRERVSLKLDTLDDPPPRSLRTPSPSPGGSTTAPRRQSTFQFSSEIEQQRQPQPQARSQSGFQQQQQRRPQSQVYNATPKSSFMDNISSRGAPGPEPTQPQRRQLPQPQHQRSQSQGQQSQPRFEEQQQQQRSGFSRPTAFDSATGLPAHHQQAMQGYAPPLQAPLSRQPSQRQLPQQYNDRQSAPSTPHQQPINIESPAPLKMANIIKMEADGQAHEQQQEQFQQHNQHQYQGQMPSSNAPSINVSGASEAPRVNIHHTGGTAMSSGTHRSSPMIPMINFDAPSPPSSGPGMPMINISEAPSGQSGPPPPNIQVFEIPGISVAGPEFDDHPSNGGGGGGGGAPQISIGVSGDDDHNSNHNSHHGHSHNHNHGQPQRQQQQQQSRFANNRPPPTRSGTGGLICGGCEGPIVGRIVSAMGVRWHPQCFRCTVCQELLEHVSSYENEGRPYCHLDYHENFAPRCYSCKTPIIEEQFISLDDPALGKRTYHMEHFFCAECGDPFLTPSMSRTSGELALSGDGDFEGFTVYKGHPYCEACHVRLRLPKCKKCKKSIRDHERAVEALGGKWCWTCFVCEGCERPFDDPSFFQRDNRPYCEHCFSIILRNEV